jgi:hypothetical protein
MATFSAVSRSTLPLLLDSDDRFNKDLFGGDEELLGMTKKLRASLFRFRKFGYIKCHKKPIGYSRKHTELITGLIKS